MSPVNAYATPEYPLLVTVIPGGEGGVSRGNVGLVLALLVDGIPTFLSTHVIPEDREEDVMTSLRSGDVRVTVVGMAVAPGGNADRGLAGPDQGLPAAFVSLLCADGRRLNLARILGRDTGTSPERLARFITREIARGVQIPDLAGAS